MKKILMVILAAVMSLTFLGCKDAQVYNVNNMAIETSSGQKITSADVEKAIIRAGAGLGWVMKKVNDGNIQGTLTLRNHMAVVSVKYNAREYSINYVDSSNLNYNSADNTIHSNYNGWVQTLNKAIQVQISTL